MPTRVVAVKRAPRRPFELIRRAPAWLRAIFVAARAGRNARRDAGRTANERKAAPDAAPERGTGPLLAFERASGIALPAWVGAGQVEACGECHRCVEACPARALELLSTAPNGGPAAMGGPASLFLRPGSCIGCADCVRVCPSSLLSMKSEGSRVGQGARPERVDLFARTNWQSAGAAS